MITYRTNFILYFYRMTTVSYDISGGRDSYSYAECIDKYTDYLDEFENKIITLEVKNNAEYCIECVELRKSMENEKLKLQECYKKKYIPLSADQEQTINNFIENCSGKSQSRCDSASSVQNNVASTYETQHPKGDKQKQLDETESVQKVEVLQVPEDLTHHASPSNTQDNEHQSGYNHAFIASIQQDTSTETTIHKDYSTHRALDSNANEEPLHTIHTEKLESHSKIPGKKLHEDSLKDGLPDTQHNIEKTVENKEFEGQGLATEHNKPMSVAAKTYYSEKHIGDVLIPISPANIDTKGVEPTNSVNHTVGVVDTSIGRSSQSDVTPSYYYNMGSTSDDKPIHDTHSRNEDSIVLQSNIVSSIGTPTSIGRVDNISLGIEINADKDTSENPCDNAYIEEKTHVSKNTCSAVCNSGKSCNEIIDLQLSTDEGDNVSHVGELTLAETINEKERSTEKTVIDAGKSYEDLQWKHKDTVDYKQNLQNAHRNSGSDLSRPNENSTTIGKHIQTTSSSN
ncbi:variable surface protein [Plasmodium gonderi]|uniref:Variable surface protein n=1 Tax=Plasmodium gonderi TaxID=77519 RepID=A0A1Y1JH53_PLAGO|nr:variable surface protein [Plasmodium gonderi]GAW79404.1 variable surface protein [Plasmodium gonderi]